MCKIRHFCTLPKGFVGLVYTPCIARVRDGLRVLSDRAQTEETKCVPLNNITENTFASVYKRSFISSI